MSDNQRLSQEGSTFSGANTSGSVIQVGNIGGNATISKLEPQVNNLLFIYITLCKTNGYLLSLLDPPTILNLRKSFFTWLGPSIDADRDHDAILQKRYNGTGNWILERHLFQQWYESSTSQLLWCWGVRMYSEAT